MININKLKDILAEYKSVFISQQWPNEKYKWEAVKCFQDNWNIDASDLPEMLNKALEKTLNLLVSKNNFPKGMLLSFAKSAPEEVRVRQGNRRGGDPLPPDRADAVCSSFEAKIPLSPIRAPGDRSNASAHLRRTPPSLRSVRPRTPPGAHCSTIRIRCRIHPGTQCCCVPSSDTV